MAAPRGAYRRLLAQMNATTQSEMSRVSAELGGDVATEKVKLQKDMRDFDVEIRRMRRASKKRSERKGKHSVLGMIVGGLIGGPAGAALGSYAGSRSGGQSIRGFEKDYGQVEGKFLLNAKEIAADSYDEAVATLSDMNADSKLMDALTAGSHAMTFNAFKTAVMPKYKAPIDLGAKIKKGFQKTFKTGEFSPQAIETKRIDALKKQVDAQHFGQGINLNIAEGYETIAGAGERIQDFNSTDLSGVEGIGSQKPGFVSLEDRMTSGFELPTNLNEPLLNPGRPNVPGMAEGIAPDIQKELNLFDNMPLENIDNEFNQGMIPFEPLGPLDKPNFYDSLPAQRGMTEATLLDDMKLDYDKFNPKRRRAYSKLMESNKSLQASSGSGTPLFGDDSVWRGLLSKQQEFAKKNKIAQLLRTVNNPTAMPQSIDRAKQELEKLGYNYGI